MADSNKEIRDALDAELRKRGINPNPKRQKLDPRNLTLEQIEKASPEELQQLRRSWEKIKNKAQAGFEQETLFPTPQAGEEARYLKGATPERTRAVRNMVDQLSVTASPGAAWADPNAVTAAQAEAGVKARITDIFARSPWSLEQLRSILGGGAKGDQYFNPPTLDVYATRQTGGGRHSTGAMPSLRPGISEEFYPSIRFDNPPASAWRVAGWPDWEGAQQTERVLAHEFGHEVSTRSGPEGTGQRVHSTMAFPTAGDVDEAAKLYGTEEARADLFARKTLPKFRKPGTAHAKPTPLETPLYPKSVYYDPEGGVATNLHGLTPEEAERGAQLFRRAWGEQMMSDPKALNEVQLYEMFDPDVELPGPRVANELTRRLDARDAAAAQMMLSHPQPGGRETVPEALLQRGEPGHIRLAGGKGVPGGQPELFDFNRAMMGDLGRAAPRAIGEGAAALLVPIAANAVANRVGGEGGDVIRNAGIGAGLGMFGGPKTAAVGAGLAALGTILKDRLFS